MHDEQESSYVVRVGQVWVDQAGNGAWPIFNSARLPRAHNARSRLCKGGCLPLEAHDVPGEPAMPVAHRHALGLRRVDHRRRRMQVAAEVVPP